ncbi:MAG: phosphate ABC transporter substrate-binding protein PstS [Bordetella sp. SCN 67-23]|nr:phosphate ABC transporter substrate-binding protein PstS [Burkholderiales bacterium]ODS69382.1 MAG: phosphate ABC transporter substrate-binding protein PstS [Bordetella sp. SCN 67-23]OJW88172.1 MAG: phosphate ABC transporter substrate-binding protein PstS [Burkholderiales bacterium 67-32]
MFKLVFKQVSVGVVLGVAALSAQAADITGAGASFPYPIYAKWASDYKAATGNTVNYQSIGSGGGQKQIIAKTVDFGASDDPMSGDDLAKNGLVQFPAVIGGIVPVVNLQGIQPGQLKFTGALLADIYLGKVKKWNDEAIAKLNPGVNLPAADIIVVHRSDGSGTTFGWTNYLSKVSADWKSSVGEGKAVKWPAGQGGKGNEGVANYVKQFAGAIGYVEYAYAKQNKLSHGQVQNKDGKFVQPEEAAFAAAAANADWKSAPGMGVILNNEPGDKSWPITSATFILMHKAQDKPTQGAEVLKFFDWAFKNGKKSASELDYVALPDAVTTQIRTLWKSDIKDTSGKSLY